jgi:hypothetical protein
MLRAAVSGAVLVAEALEQAPEGAGREEVEHHHDVGLLGDLVAVGFIALGAQDAVEALDVPVTRPVGVPVELQAARSPRTG